MAIRRLLAVALSSCLVSGSALATNVFNLEGFGPVSRALGGAGVAHDVGPAAMMYNPATLGLMESESAVYVGLDLIGTDIDIKNTSTGANASSGKDSMSSNRGPVYYAPEAAYTTRMGDLVLGVGAFAQGGLGTEYGKNSFLSTTTVNNVETGLENSSRLLNLRIPFAASYKVNDRLQVGGSVDVIWTQLNLELLLDVSQVGSLAGDGRVSGSLVPALLAIPGLSGAHFGFTKDNIVGGGVDGWGVGGKLGFTYQFTDATRFGMAYNFETNVEDLSGHAVLTAVDNANHHIPLSGRIKIRDFQNPAQLSLGVDHRVNDKLTVVADIQRVFWEDVMKDIDVGFVQDGTGANLDVLLPQNYKDINIYTIGAEYQYDNAWTLRAGFSHADQAVRSNLLFAVIPGILQNHLTGGFSYAWSKSSKLDFALSYAFEETMSNSAQPNTSVPIKASHRQLNAVIGYTYRF
ncbi:OmpP1/FadL family transporter [Thiolapillus brandeum]|uniref:Long-chain fatty acid transporter n=1 Tax=Thiolapillus brandeum TaxID=1076588 RepID=A0A7U6JGY7_9GAMM|nr:outer membrane protein transport protein [Thiolapillus brandeum]BAO43836.1 long-chain fatty acid transporter [Thiolapillus brandeum]